VGHQGIQKKSMQEKAGARISRKALLHSAGILLMLTFLAGLRTQPEHAE
jgi:hypothetical protein